MPLFEFHRRFSIDPVPGTLQTFTFRDVLSPASQQQVDARGLQLDTPDGRLAALRMLLPLCVDHAPLRITDTPVTPTDANFWQYPAITEKLAWQVHAALPAPAWQPRLAGPVHCYLGLPWATWIDKFFNPRGTARAEGKLPATVQMVFGARLKGYRALAEEWSLRWGEEVRMHTVCQHIYWERLLPHWVALGITDIHLSHCTTAAIAQAASFGLRAHSWPLAAVNSVNPERQAGLDPARPVRQRRLLASFIGAHMPHYRSDVRLRLAGAFAAGGELPADVHIALCDDWHFNPLVYGFQIDGKTLSPEQQAHAIQANRRYNEILSDSVFALCPEGAGPNTIRLWEALAAGAIPVVIVEDWVWPAIPEADGIPYSWGDAVLVCRRDELAGLPALLRGMRERDPGRLERMQQSGALLYQRFARQSCFPSVA